MKHKFCKYCNPKEDGFVILNATKKYSGIEIAMSHKGMLRVRIYRDGKDWLHDGQDAMPIYYCPMCGRRLEESE